MSISAVSSGYPILQQSSKMAEDATLDIQHHQTENTKQPSALDFNNVENTVTSDKPSSTTDTHDALIKLDQAQQYNRVGSSVIQREQAMLGSLLDIRI
ncbi:hypothetical protein [Vibrio cincinnatiensis]|uniref:hypothetical protein n=1 Tax=Vibrio cincinnatiensis TaxID=675 RepID=UPI001EDE93DA|nr:hypothetical protein [Vibrio cincinnatiensis]MCG3728535.1 hypothetical protein [Vibrio cincinnatiensis]